jgi:hypothetical protein
LTGHSARIAGNNDEYARGKALNKLPLQERAAVLSDRALPQYLRARLFTTLDAPACQGSDGLFAETVTVLDPNTAAEIIHGSAVFTFKHIVGSGVDANWLAAFLNNPGTNVESAAGYMTVSTHLPADITYEKSSLIFDSVELDPFKAGQIANVFPRFPKTDTFAKPRAFPFELLTIFAGMKCLTRMKEILPFLSEEATAVMQSVLGKRAAGSPAE